MTLPWGVTKGKSQEDMARGMKDTQPKSRRCAAAVPQRRGRSGGVQKLADAVR